MKTPNHKLESKFNTDSLTATAKIPTLQHTGCVIKTRDEIFT
jgi:hypothetical protein